MLATAEAAVNSVVASTSAAFNNFLAGLGTYQAGLPVAPTMPATNLQAVDAVFADDYGGVSPDTRFKATISGILQWSNIIGIGPGEFSNGGLDYFGDLPIFHGAPLSIGDDMAGLTKPSDASVNLGNVIKYYNPLTGALREALSIPQPLLDRSAGAEVDSERSAGGYGSSVPGGAHEQTVFLALGAGGRGSYQSLVQVSFDVASAHSVATSLPASTVNYPQGLDSQAIAWVAGLVNNASSAWNSIVAISQDVESAVQAGTNAFLGSVNAGLASFGDWLSATTHNPLVA